MKLPLLDTRNELNHTACALQCPAHVTWLISSRFVHNAAYVRTSFVSRLEYIPLRGCVPLSLPTHLLTDFGAVFCLLAIVTSPAVNIREPVFV